MSEKKWSEWKAMRVNEGGEVVRPFPVRGKPSSGSPLPARVWTGCHTVLFTVGNIHVALFLVAVNGQQHRWSSRLR
jgi:hypothetical protein